MANILGIEESDMFLKRSRSLFVASWLLILALSACGTVATPDPSYMKPVLKSPTKVVILPTTIANLPQTVKVPPVPATATMGMDMSDMDMDVTPSISGDPAKGKMLFEIGNGNPAVPACLTCHNVDSEEVKVGPSLAEIGHHGVEHAKEYGQTIEQFLRESIVEPNRRLMTDPTHVFAANGVSIMYQNYGKDLTEQQINDLIVYLMTLR
jgi:cytochrome c2